MRAGQGRQYFGIAAEKSKRSSGEIDEPQSLIDAKGSEAGVAIICARIIMKSIPRFITVCWRLNNWGLRVTLHAL